MTTTNNSIKCLVKKIQGASSGAVSGAGEGVIASNLPGIKALLESGKANKNKWVRAVSHAGLPAAGGLIGAKVGWDEAANSPQCMQVENVPGAEPPPPEPRPSQAPAPGAGGVPPLPHMGGPSKKSVLLAKRLTQQVAETAAGLAVQLHFSYPDMSSATTTTAIFNQMAPAFVAEVKSLFSDGQIGDYHVFKGLLEGTLAMYIYQSRERPPASEYVIKPRYLDTPPRDWNPSVNFLP